MFPANLIVIDLEHLLDVPKLVFPPATVYMRYQGRAFELLVGFYCGSLYQYSCLEVHRLPELDMV